MNSHKHEIKNLSDCFRNYKKSASLIFDGFESENIILTHENLQDSLNKLKEQIIDCISRDGNVSLFAIYSKSWNKRFYELFLSIVYSNNAYLILDSKWPLDYIKNVIQNTQPNFLIYDSDEEDIFKFLDATELVFDLLRKNKFKIKSFKTAKKRNNLAYVISTSGTTGTPKVVEVCNSSIITNIIELSGLFELTENDIIYQASSLTFDPSVVELFCSFNSNSKILILPEHLKLNPDHLIFYLQKHKVNILQLTPSLYKNISSHLLERINLKTIVLGGELFPNKCTIIRKLIENGTKVFNIYGVTELSCWSSCHKVTFDDLNDEKGVPIGQLLSQTEFYVQDSNKKFVELKSLPLKSIQFEGALFHSSQSRICFINGQIQKFIESGDNIKISNSQIYLNGRTNRTVKINAKLTDLFLLELVCKRLNWIENCCAIFEDNNLILFVVELFKQDDENKENILRKYIQSTLPSHYEPIKIFILSFDVNLPITSHGKLNAEKLVQNFYYNQTVNESMAHLKNWNEKDIEKFLISIWKRTLEIEPKDTDDFINSGGNSLKAVILINHIEDYLKMFVPNFKINKMLDVLLKSNFSDFLKYIQSSVHFQTENNQLENDIVPVKRRKFSSTEFLSKLVENTEIIGWISKFDKKINQDYYSDLDDEILDINLDWKYDTLKCVDATPLLVLQEQRELIMIGSHSSKFFCINDVGNLVWQYETMDRIESSATVSRCKNYVLFGSYDSYFYVLNLNDGSLKWKYKTEDVIKSSPCVDENGLVYFGSHDKHIYCLNIEETKLVWRVLLDQSSIFSGPIIFKDSLLVSTLGGNLFALNSKCGDIYWKHEFGKPIFTSPAVNMKTENIFIGTCGNKFYCLNNKNIKWTFETGMPIFSSACLINVSNLVVFGCHDNYLYCLKQNTGEINWKINCESQIYSNPTLLESAHVCCMSSDGIIYIINVNGSIVFRKDLFQLKNSCYSSPIIFKNKFFIASRNNHLSSFKIKFKI